MKPAQRAPASGDSFFQNGPYGKILRAASGKIIMKAGGDINIFEKNHQIQDLARIKVDLHAIYNNSRAIDAALENAFEEAISKKIREIEIIPGKGSGQLKKKVLRYLDQPHIKPLYHRMEKDSKNFGRLFIYLKF